MASFFTFSSLLCLSGVTASSYVVKHGSSGYPSVRSVDNFFKRIISVGQHDIAPFWPGPQVSSNSGCGNCICCLPVSAGRTNQNVCPPGCQQQCNCGTYVVNTETGTGVTGTASINKYSVAPIGGSSSIPSTITGPSGIPGSTATGSSATGSINNGANQTQAPGGSGIIGQPGATGTGTEIGGNGQSGSGISGNGNNGCNCNQYPTPPSTTTPQPPCICNPTTTTTTTTTTPKPCTAQTTTTTTTTTTTPAPCTKTCTCTPTCTTTCPPQKPCPECPKCPPCQPLPTGTPAPGAYPVAPVFPGSSVGGPGSQAGPIFGAGGIISTGTGLTATGVVSGTGNGVSVHGTGSTCCFVSLFGTSAHLTCGCAVQGVASLDSCVALSKANQCRVTSFPVNNVNAYITKGNVFSCESAVASGYIQWSQINAQCNIETVTGTGDNGSATGASINIPTNGDLYSVPTAVPSVGTGTGKDAYPQPVNVAAVSGISALALAAVAVYILV